MAFEVRGVRFGAVPEAGAIRALNGRVPRTQITRRISRCRAASRDSSTTGMKSWISATPSAAKNRVISTFVSGK